MDTQDNQLRLRPRFKKKVDFTIDEVKESITNSIKTNAEKCNGKIVDNHVILKIPLVQQHYWSPQLTLELQKENEETIIRGLFGPKPAVWTMFVFFYSAIGFLTLMGLIFGLSQMMLKMNPYGLWSVPIGGSILIGLFIISKIGQGFSQDQMHQLNTVVTEALVS
jgi:hypothetical protein